MIKTELYGVLFAEGHKARINTEDLSEEELSRLAVEATNVRDHLEALARNNAKLLSISFNPEVGPPGEELVSECAFGMGMVLDMARCFGLLQDDLQQAAAERRESA